MFYVTKTKECKKRRRKKKNLPFSPPWEFRIPVSSSRAPYPTLLFGDSRLLINLSRNWVCHYYEFILIIKYGLLFINWSSSSDFLLWGSSCQGRLHKKHLMSISWVNGNPLQYSCLENPMHRISWQARVHGVSRVGHDLTAETPPHPE